MDKVVRQVLPMKRYRITLDRTVNGRNVMMGFEVAAEGFRDADEVGDEWRDLLNVRQNGWRLWLVEEVVTVDDPSTQGKPALGAFLG